MGNISFAVRIIEEAAPFSGKWKREIYQGNFCRYFGVNFFSFSSDYFSYLRPISVHFRLIQMFTFYFYRVKKVREDCDWNWRKKKYFPMHSRDNNNNNNPKKLRHFGHDFIDEAVLLCYFLSSVCSFLMFSIDIA